VQGVIAFDASMVGQIEQIRPAINYAQTAFQSTTPEKLSPNDLADPAEIPNLERKIAELEQEISQKNARIESLSKKVEQEKKEKEEQLSVIMRRVDKVKEENSRLLESIRRASTSGSQEVLVIEEATPWWQHVVNLIAMGLLFYIGYSKYNQTKLTPRVTFHEEVRFHSDDDKSNALTAEIASLQEDDSTLNHEAEQEGSSDSEELETPVGDLISSMLPSKEEASSQDEKSKPFDIPVIDALLQGQEEANILEQSFISLPNPQTTTD